MSCCFKQHLPVLGLNVKALQGIDLLASIHPRAHKFIFLSGISKQYKSALASAVRVAILATPVPTKSVLYGSFLPGNFLKEVQRGLPIWD